MVLLCFNVFVLDFFNMHHLGLPNFRDIYLGPPLKQHNTQKKFMYAP